MVHASHPYKAVGNTTVSRTLSFIFFLHCPFQIEIIFVNRVVAIASLLLISGVLFPFASILAPRYSKLHNYVGKILFLISKGSKKKNPNIFLIFGDTTILR